MTTINDLSVASSVSSDDKLPLWQNANGVTRALPVSVLDARYLSQDDVAALAADSKVETFVSSTQPNPGGLPTFVAGTTFSLTLENQYYSGANIEVFFDGTFQGPDQYGLVGYGLTFLSPIPLGVQNVYVRGGASRVIGAPSDGTVTDLSVANGTRLKNRINDIFDVKDGGAIGDGISDDTAKIKTIVGDGVLSELPPGSYLLNAAASLAAIVLDYSLAATNEPVGPLPHGMGLRGRNPRQSILYAGTSGMYSVQIKGTASGSNAGCHIYDTVEKISFSGVPGSNGMHVFASAYGALRDLVFSGLTTGLYLESVLSYEFSNLTFNSNSNGVVAAQGGGFSYPNALLFQACRFRANSSLGYSGNDPHANISFAGGSFEGNGTQGNAFTGAVSLNFDGGSEGAVGANFDGVYFEGNAGGSDIVLNNTGSTYVTVVIKGCNFNRISGSNYVTNNIHTLGKIRLILIGCTFVGYNDYVEDVSRLYVKGDVNLKVTCIGCVFGSATAQGTLSNIDGA